MPKLKNKELVKSIYNNIVQTSRSKFFYLNLDVDDTVEGRFDIIVFHAFLIFQYFVDIKNKRSNLAQELFDYMFLDFDSNLREMGFGDIAVNKRMKQFIKAFYGRINNYIKSSQEIQVNNDKSHMQLTIISNIYKNKKKNKKIIKFWEEYFIKNKKMFSSRSLDENIKDNFNFIKVSD